MARSEEERRRKAFVDERRRSQQQATNRFIECYIQTEAGTETARNEYTEQTVSPCWKWALERYTHTHVHYTVTHSQWYTHTLWHTHSDTHTHTLGTVTHPQMSHFDTFTHCAQSHYRRYYTYWLLDNTVTHSMMKLTIQLTAEHYSHAPWLSLVHINFEGQHWSGYVLDLYWHCSKNFRVWHHSNAPILYNVSRVCIHTRECNLIIYTSCTCELDNRC